MIEDSANNLLYIFKGNGATGTNGVLTGFTLIDHDCSFQRPTAPAPSTSATSTATATPISSSMARPATPLRSTTVTAPATSRLPSTLRPRTGPLHAAAGYEPRRHSGHGGRRRQGRHRDLSRHRHDRQSLQRDRVLAARPGLASTASPATAATSPPSTPDTLNILTTTPIGLSVLEGNGSLSYALKGIYNIGPGRSSFALADFYGTGALISPSTRPKASPSSPPDANGDGGFQTSNAYAALAPALGSVVGKFSNAANNPNG